MGNVSIHRIETRLRRKLEYFDSRYLFEGYPEAEGYIKTLLLRALLDGGLFRYIAFQSPFLFNDIGHMFGIKDFDEKKIEHKKEILQNLYEVYKNVKQQPPYLLERNITAIAKLLQLNRVEQDLLILFALFNENEFLESFGSNVELNFAHALRLMAMMTGHSYSKIKEALLPTSKLMRSKILRLSYHRTQGFMDFFDFEIGVTRFFMEHKDVIDLFKEQFLKVPKSSLKIDDFNYMQEMVEMMKNLLQSRVCQQKGANILLYGKAGYGKTELVKLLSQELGSNLYEISYMREDGEAISGNGRLDALNLSTMVLDNKSFILFDEFDDIDDRSFFNRRFSHKAWLNRFLEEGSHIIFWVANSIDFLDEAMIRRFDLVLEMPDIPKKKRIVIAKSYLRGLDSAFIEHLASQKRISPGVFAILAENIKDSGFSDEGTIVRLINEKLKAQGLEPVHLQKSKDTLGYSLKNINADYDLDRLTELLSKEHRGRLCFYGMPGTGKTEYAKFLAKMLGKEIVVKKASDLLSMWVGGSEKNIRAAFEEAKAEDAIMLIDEADSFLADRANAQRSWEVSQVNEMLTQIENFDGIFIATTNFINYLDKASLRRFDLKIEFKPLNYWQKEALFNKLCEDFGFESEYLQELKRLDPVTLGDFAAIKRSARLLPFENVCDIFQRLKKEVEMKHHEAKVGLV